MIFIGSDLIEVDRIRALIHRWEARFLRRIFSPEEIHYCQQRAHPAVHFAGRFAAKEAVKKALYASGRIEPVSFRQIEVQRNSYGVPLVRLGEGGENIRVSISHTLIYAMATAILES